MLYGVTSFAFTSKLMKPKQAVSNTIKPNEIFPFNFVDCRRHSGVVVSKYALPGLSPGLVFVELACFFAHGFSERAHPAIQNQHVSSAEDSLNCVTLVLLCLSDLFMVYLAFTQSCQLPTTSNWIVSGAV